MAEMALAVEMTRFSVACAAISSMAVSEELCNWVPESEREKMASTMPAFEASKAADSLGVKRPTALTRAAESWVKS